jgi:signal transduction histidine kinase/ActR/RegA family two-component response regulator
LSAREERLAVELNAVLRLQELSTHLINGHGIDALFDHVLDTAVAIMHSDFSSMQVAELNRENALVLRLLAYRGFHPESARHWQIVGTDDQTSCGAALRNSERVCIRDTEAWDALSGTADLVAYRRSGIRAVQSTPLISRSGEFLGMISTHWRQPYLPSESALRTFDILARQVADLIERKQSEDRLCEAGRRKDEFLATLAHELRNPLAPIRSAAQVLAKPGIPDQTISWCQVVIERQVAHMARLLDDLLDVSRISRNRLALYKARVTLASVFESAIETSRPVIDAAGHELMVTLPRNPVYLEADLVRLAQVFSNLLNNAAKYTPNGGEIRLTAEMRGEMPDEIMVSIKDNGMGIAEDMLPRLFQMFSQAESSSMATRNGLGIGLALAKAFVELHGGTVSARSEGRGRGSEFLVRLPILVATAGRPGCQRTSMEEEATPLSTRRILIVDDNRDAADTLAALLQLDGVEAVIARDGLEGVKKATAFLPDVILLDIGLPEMDGYEVCRRIRETQRGRSVVVLALSGWGQQQDHRKSHEAGFDGHLVKPVDHGSLLKWLGKRASP